MTSILSRPQYVTCDWIKAITKLSMWDLSVCATINDHLLIVHNRVIKQCIVKVSLCLSRLYLCFFEIFATIVNVNGTMQYQLLGDIIWRHWTRLTFVQVMACCHTAPSHYLNKCSITINDVLWHSPEGNFIGNSQDLIWVCQIITSATLLNGAMVSGNLAYFAGVLWFLSDIFVIFINPLPTQILLRQLRKHGKIKLTWYWHLSVASCMVW